MENSLQLPSGYQELLQDLKARIRTAQVRAAFAVSRELVLLYWSIGRDILARQGREGWGAKGIDRLAQDLQREFPGVEGFSPRNLKYMRSLAEAWPDPAIVPQLVALLPWGHLPVLLDQRKDPVLRERYLRAAVEPGWSRNVLVLQIKSGLHQREGKALTNLHPVLPPPRFRSGRADSQRPLYLRPPHRYRGSKKNGRSSGDCCFLGAICCWSSAGASPSSAVRCRYQSGITTSISTCSSWASALREPLWSGGGVCLQRHPETDRGLHLPGPARVAGAYPRGAYPG